MNIAIRYYTKSGNTKKLAEAIAAELGVTALPVSAGLNENVDMLFLGSSVYAAGVDGEVKQFIAGLDVAVGQIVCFSTAALLKSTYEQVKKLAAARGIRVSDKEYHCRGAFAMLHKGKPDNDNVADAKKFARLVVG